MSDPLPHALYELFLSIQSETDLSSFLETALTQLTGLLECTGAAVQVFQESSADLAFRELITVPSSLRQNTAYIESCGRLIVNGSALNEFKKSLPIEGSSRKGGCYHIIELPSFGVLILIKEDKHLASELLIALHSFAGNLARRCAICSSLERLKIAEEALNYDELRFEALLHLNSNNNLTTRQMVNLSLEEAIRLTRSTIGYIASISENEKVMTVYTWSKSAMKECTAIEKPIIYHIEKTGLWGEALRQRRPIVTNDYNAPNPWKKGIPKGHIQIRRHLNVPIFDNNRIVLVVGVGNKSEDYDEKDIKQLTLLMGGMWRIFQHEIVKDQLKSSNESTKQTASTGPAASQRSDLNEEAGLATLKLTDLFDLKEIQKIQDAFAEATGVASIITDPRGHPITTPSRFCRLCNDIIRKTEKGQANCYHSDAILGRKNPEGPVAQLCLSGGLWDGGASICVGGVHIANWLIGQVLDNTFDMEKMLQYARDIGADEHEYREALGEVTRMPKEQFLRVCNALFIIARLLSDLAYENVLKKREIEETVRSRTEELRLMQTCIYNAADAIYWIDESGRFLYVNDAACKMLKYSQEELASLRITDIDTSMTDESWLSFWNLVKHAGSATIQTGHRNRFGSIINIEISSTYHKSDTKPCLFLFARDISERAKAIEELRQNEIRAKALLEISQLSAYSFEEIYEFTLRAALEITGSSIGLIGFSSDDGKSATINTWSCNNTADYKNIEKPLSFNIEQRGILGESLRLRKPFIANNENEIQHTSLAMPSGHIKFARLISIPVFDDRNLALIVALADKKGDYTESDVTQTILLFDGMWHIVRQKRAELALKKNEERYALAITGSNTGVWDVDLTRDIGYFSSNVNEWLGIEDKEIYPFSVIYPSIVYPDDREKRAQILRNHMAGKGPYVGEYRVVTSSGATLWFNVKGESVRDESGKPVRMVGSVTDITERVEAELQHKQMEMQLMHAQKLESIGQLAAGIAHEINTPIQYVGDNTRFLSDSFNDIINALNECRAMITQCAADSGMAEKARAVENVLEAADIPYLIEEIPTAISQNLEGIRHISRIVMAMKEFSHPDSDEIVLINLNSSIESTITVARNEWKYVAALETELDGTLPHVPCKPGAINQVVLNLIINAAHAIGDKINQEIQEKGVIRVKTCHSGNFAEIRVSDTGTGIPEKYHSRIFDPFFTTKMVGKGTGQGLSIVYNVVVKQHKGTITFETEEGKGTEFIVRLPLNGKTLNCLADV
ncbi:MAG: PocR ligand-binding domain-containing protein [Vulcanimicrobiota bacterium]